MRATCGRRVTIPRTTSRRTITSATKGGWCASGGTRAVAGRTGGNARPVSRSWRCSTSWIRTSRGRVPGRRSSSSATSRAPWGRSAPIRRRSRCRRSIRTISPREGRWRATTTASRSWIARSALCCVSSKPMGSPTTRSSSSIRIMAWVCRAESGCCTTRACTCRCSFASPRNGSTAHRPRLARRRIGW
jgi:hypothetical protein